MSTRYPPKPKYDPKDDQDQKQDQDQDQDQKQDQLQAQLQGQAQGQAQGQGQFQFAVQSVDSKVESDNKNENENDNKNENSNENDLKNEVDNKLDNKVDNELDNKVDNSVDNKVENKVENSVENKVDVKVDVDIDIGLEGIVPRDDDVIDIEQIQNIYGSVIMPDVVDQKLEGGGNQFNIDQVNNMVDNDKLDDPKVSAEDGKFEWDAKADGGFVHIGDPDVDMKGDGSTFGDAVTSSADAIVSQEAFTQNIVMGANIQFNSIEMTNTVDFDDAV